MAYMYVCPGCRSFFKAKSKDRVIMCPKCSNHDLLDLKLDDETWGTLDFDEKKAIITAGGAVAPEGSEGGAADKTVRKKVIKKKVIKKKVVRKVVKRPVTDGVKREVRPEAGPEIKPAVKEEIKPVIKPAVKPEVKPVVKPAVKPEVKPVVKPEVKPVIKPAARKEAGNEDTGKEKEDNSVTGQNWEDVFAAEEKREEKEEEIKEENKASSGAAGVLASFIRGGKGKREGRKQEESSAGKADKDEAFGSGEETDKREGSKEEHPEKEKVKLNKKNVAIVAVTTGVLLLYLVTMTFIIPGFKMQKELDILRSATVGDAVQYGRYRGQDGWIVLDKKGTKLLCISDYTIYDDTNYDGGWDDSELRKWFNSVYINSAFNVFERMRITSTKDIQKDYPGYSRDVGMDTPDKVFIISDNEMKKYIGMYKEAMIEVNDDEIRAVCWIEIK